MLTVIRDVRFNFNKEDFLARDFLPDETWECCGISESKPFEGEVIDGKKDLVTRSLVWYSIVWYTFQIWWHGCIVKKKLRQEGGVEMVEDSRKGRNKGIT